jgi:putative flippase GtrA
MARNHQKFLNAVINSPRFGEIVRFYFVGLLNTGFGLGLYFLLVYIGINLFISQAIAQVVGATFNYFTYRRGVFRDADHARAKFAVSYLINYLLSVAALAVMHSAVKSPYLAGFLTSVMMSLINYFLLKFGVFTKRKSEA